MSSVDVEGVLSSHRLVHRNRHAGPFGGPFRCTCGKWAAVIVADGCDGEGVSKEDQHIAHVAAVLREQIAAWLTGPDALDVLMGHQQVQAGLSALAAHLSDTEAGWGCGVSERRAPVNGSPRGTVAWWEHEKAWEAYQRRHSGQSAKRIAERGGFGIDELTFQLGHLPTTWQPGPEALRQMEYFGVEPTRSTSPALCCDLHNRNCEPPSELCCSACTEAAHPHHGDGSACIAPDLSSQESR